MEKKKKLFRIVAIILVILMLIPNIITGVLSL